MKTAVGLVALVVALGCDDFSCPDGTELSEEGRCLAPDAGDGGTLDDGGAADAPDTCVGEESCSGVDDDCDGTIDEGFELATFFRDADGDGVGGEESVEACAAPPGHVAESGDCDDAEVGTNPAADETCDGVDNDCDFGIDEGVVTTVGAPARMMVGPISNRGLSLVRVGDEALVAYVDAADVAVWSRLSGEGEVLDGPHPIDDNGRSQSGVELLVTPEGVVASWVDDVGGLDRSLRRIDPASPATAGPVQFVRGTVTPLADMAYIGGKVVVVAFADDGRAYARAFDGATLAAEGDAVLVGRGPTRIAPTNEDFGFFAYRESDSVFLDRIGVTPFAHENLPRDHGDCAEFDVATSEGHFRYGALLRVDNTNSVTFHTFQLFGFGATLPLRSHPLTFEFPEEIQSVDLEPSFGSFDLVVCGEPGYRCSYRNVTGEGVAGPEGSFSASMFISDGEVVRVAPDRGLVVYNGAVPGSGDHDLFMQAIGCGS